MVYLIGNRVSPGIESNLWIIEVILLCDTSQLYMVQFVETHNNFKFSVIWFYINKGPLLLLKLSYKHRVPFYLHYLIE